MKTVKRLPSRPALITLVAVMTFASSAVAYIDAGSGSYIFQLLIGAVVGSAVAVKVFWRRVAAFFGGKRARKR